MELSRIDDGSLMELCVEDPPRRPALSELVRRYGNLVLQTITWTYRRCCPARESEAQDVFQEVFASLFEESRRRLKMFDPEKAGLGTYLAAIARNASLNTLRCAGKETEELSDSIADQSALPESEAEQAERLTRISKALAGFTPGEQLFYHLYFEELMPPETVASVLGLTIDSVYSKKAKLIEKLRKKLSLAAREG